MVTEQQTHSAHILALEAAFESQTHEIKRLSDAQLSLQRNEFGERENTLVARLDAERNASKAHVIAWTEKENILSEQADRLKDELQHIYASKAWKLTAATRWFCRKKTQ
jgi:hypothetical protein